MKQTFQIPTAVCIAVFFALVLGSCDSQGAQDDFVTQASAPAAGITKILDNASGGTICSEDTDDWRTSPIYNGIVLVEKGATPNPASSALVTINIRVLQFDRVQGSLTLRSFGNGNNFIFLDTILDAGSPGDYVFQFNSSLLSENGLHRVYIFDGLGELVSYGDVELVANQPTSC